jgi:hypothetical protein
VAASGAKVDSCVRDFSGTAEKLCIGF